jgi:hypothetical protein
MPTGQRTIRIHDGLILLVIESERPEASGMRIAAILVRLALAQW